MRTVEEIQADLDAAESAVAKLRTELEMAENSEWHARWSALFPPNLAEILMANAHEAAARCRGTYESGSGDTIELAPGVGIWVVIDTNIPEGSDE